MNDRVRYTVTLGHRDCRNCTEAAAKAMVAHSESEKCGSLSYYLRSDDGAEHVATVFDRTELKAVFPWVG